MPDIQLTKPLTGPLTWPDSGYPSIGYTVDFVATPNNLLPFGFSLTRASTGTYFDSAGLLQTAAIDAARGTYRWNGSAFAFDGTIVEAASTNLVVQSETMTIANGYIEFSGVAGETTGVTDPFGTTKAITLSGQGGNTNVGHYRAVTFTGDGTKAVACFVKEGTSPFSGLSIFDATAGSHLHRVLITWSGGVPSLSTTVGAGTLYTPERLANGWWRILISANSVVAANSNLFAIFPDPAAVGARTTSFYGGQAEDGAAPTSYIPTTTVAVTRAADVLTAPTAGLLANGQGFAAIGARIIAVNSSGSGSLLSAYVGSGAVPLYNSATDFTIYDGVGFRASVANVLTVGAVEKLASTWNGNVYSVSANGAVANATAGAGMTLNINLRIGDDFSGSVQPISMVLQSLRLSLNPADPVTLANPF